MASRGIRAMLSGLFRTRYRIVVYRDYDGETFYRPERRKGVLGSWSGLGLGVSYREKRRAEETVAKWKEREGRMGFKEEVVGIMEFD